MSCMMYGMENIEHDCGLQENPREPECGEERHAAGWCHQCHQRIKFGEDVAKIYRGEMIHARCMPAYFAEKTLEEQADALDMVLIRGDEE